jgi:hypothetical protein
MVIVKIRAVKIPMPFVLQTYRVSDIHGFAQVPVSQLGMVKRTIEEAPVSGYVLLMLDA